MRDSSSSKRKRLVKGIKKRKEQTAISGFSGGKEKGTLLDSVGITNYMQDPKTSSRDESKEIEILVDANSEQ